MIQISESQTARALRTKRWKYAVSAPEGIVAAAAETYGETALYDLAHDPYELENLIGCASHAEVAAALRERLLAQIAEFEGQSPEITPAPDRPTLGQRSVGAGDIV